MRFSNYSIMVYSVIFTSMLLFPALMLAPFFDYIFAALSLSVKFILLIIYFAIAVYTIFFLLQSWIILKLLKPKVIEGNFDMDVLKDASIYNGINGIIMKTLMYLFGLLLIPDFVYAEVLFRMFSNMKGRPRIVQPLDDLYLIDIDDNSIIGKGALVLGHQIVNSKLYLKKVKIGKNVTIGAYSIVSPGVVIEDNVVIGANSFVRRDMVLKKSHFYAGSPAREIKKL